MPERAQYMDALAQANRVRFGRAAIRGKIRRGEITFSQALKEPFCATATIESMLVSQPLWGSRRAAKFLTRMAYQGVLISASREVRDLTERQVKALVAALGERVA